MAVEFSKVVGSYRVFVLNENEIDSVTLKAVVSKMEGMDRLVIHYSHTMIPHEDAAGPWYSNSMTHAGTLEEAEAKIKSFASSMERAHKIVPWNDDI